MEHETQRHVKVVSLRIGYKSATVEEFIDRHAPDVGRDGIYIKTTQPFPVGSVLRLQVHIADGHVVIAAVGRVAWTRDASGETSTRPAGMGIRFVKTDEPSRKLIEDLSSTRPDAGRAYEEGLRATTSSAPPGPQRASMFPASDAHAPGLDEVTMVTSRGDVVDGLMPPSSGLKKATLMGIGPLPQVVAPPQRDREGSRPDEPTLIKKVSELLDESLRDAAPSMVDYTSPVLIDDDLLTKPRHEPPPPAPATPAAEPSTPTSARRSARAGIRALVGVVALSTLVLTVTGDRMRRRMMAPLAASSVVTIAATAEATPPALQSSPRETGPGEAPIPSPSAEPPVTSEAAAPDESSVSERASSPKAPRGAVLRRNPPVVPTKPSIMPKPHWLLKPAKVDNPY